MQFKKVNPERLLNSTIQNLLYGGSTDPGYSELEAVAVLYVLLKHLQLKIKDEDEVLRQLRTENVCDHDFLKMYLKA